MTRRLQLLLDEERYQRVARVAADRQVPVAVVIRDAIDRAVGQGGQRRRAAAGRILRADPMPVPERDELLAELEELRGRRG